MRDTGKIKEGKVLMMKKVFTFFLLIFLCILVLPAYSAVTPYYQIYKDYKANPSAADKKWIGKTIDIEGIIAYVAFHDNYPVVGVAADENGKDIVYGFVFTKNSLDALREIPAAKLNMGEKVRARGEVHAFIPTSQTKTIVVYLVNSEFPESRTWQCSKCSKTFTRITKGQSTLDQISWQSRCDRGGAHNWKRIQ